jgi:two-component system, NtrC family, response regulator AtoC
MDVMANAVLVVDDEAVLAKYIHKFLSKAGYEVHLTTDIRSANAAMDEFHPDVVLLDYQLPDGNGLDALRELRRSRPGTKVIFMTGHGSIDIAVQAMKDGASEFLTKPIVLEELKVLIEKTLGQERKEQALSHFQARKGTGGLAAIKGQSAAIQSVRDKIQSLLRSEVEAQGSVLPPVLVSGETGTGKQLVARALHFGSKRASGPFIELNCASLPEHLVESELFGHERGAFTDAKERRIGLMEAANGGTLFLDEIGEMTLGTQAKLLKAVDDKVIRRVGGVRELAIDIRIVAATNRDMPRLIAEEKFRADLYYRLQMLEIVLPPLRNRGNDVESLARDFLETKKRHYNRPFLQFTPDAVLAMQRHGWPGNVRELRNAVERAVLMSKTHLIGARDLALPLAQTHSGAVKREVQNQDQITNVPQQVDLADIEKQAIQQVLMQTKWNVSEASRALGISRDTMRYRMQKHGLMKAGESTRQQ